MLEKDTPKKLLKDIFIEKGYLTLAQLSEIDNERSITGESLGDILIRKEIITPQQFDEAMASSHLELFDINNFIIDPEVTKLLPDDVVLMHKVIPVSKKNDTLTVAMVEPQNNLIIADLSRITGCKIKALLAEEKDINKIQSQCFIRNQEIKEIIATIDFSQLEKAKETGEEAHIVKLANTLINQAVQANASDIHIEPEEKNLGVRYRIDGMLYHFAFLSKFLESHLISRFKIMSGLDVSEKRIPQDGRMMIKFNNKEIDFRVSICPTYHGENLVIRILDKESLNLGLESLGFPAREFIQYTKLLNQPYGLILVTGPTGSGKTTSLYASVRKINRENINIMTVENPIEYALPRIRQVQVNDKMGLTFASILRSFLRQDPDIIMIGEIRDAETADIAVQAALTGHLVLSSLHTNDTPTAFSRLTNMNIEPFLIASAVKGVIAQRLLRKVCPKCKTEYVPSLALLKFLNLEDKVANNIKLVWGKGCDNCNNTGYKGRIGIFEFLPVTPEIQNLVADKKTAEEIRREAIKQGMKTLRDIAAEKLIAQLTSAQEVIRITQSV